MRAQQRLAVTVLAVLLAGSVLTAPARAESGDPLYVALGDSYASGLGTGRYYAPSGFCQRSPRAYPVLSAARLGATLRFRACAGARVSHVAAHQLRSLRPRTRYVSVQVGGNDAGFSRVITECAQPAWAQDCRAAVAGARAFIRHKLPSRLAGLYSQIRSRAPSARVLVVGYPRIFHDEDCNAGTWFSRTDRRLLNDTADLLNRRIGARADRSGFGFANPTRAFLGHAVCDSPAWINGLSEPVNESYHPNRAGQHRYAGLVTRRLR
jgi:lysophospholipase L1-like esterase